MIRLCLICDLINYGVSYLKALLERSEEHWSSLFTTVAAAGISCDSVCIRRGPQQDVLCEGVGEKSGWPMSMRLSFQGKARSAAWTML